MYKMLILLPRFLPIATKLDPAEKAVPGNANVVKLCTYNHTTEI